MKTYWDLSDKERAALDREQIARFERLELMAAGVLITTPPALEPEPETPDFDAEVYDVSRGWSVIASFACIADARAFVGLNPLPVGSAYLNGASVPFLEAPGDLSVAVRRVYSNERWLAHKAAIESREAIRERNAAEQKRYEDEAKKQADELSSMRDDLARCREDGRRFERIASVYAEYLTTAGDADVAARFLAKAFAADDIERAAKWTGVAIPGTGVEAAA